MAQTIVEKISQTHMTEGPDRPLRAGDFLSIRPDHVMTHDNTSAVMKKFKAIGAESIYNPTQPVFTADHDIQNTEESNLAKYRSMEKFATQHGINFYPPGTGIGHQVMVEQGYVLPGDFIVASDSHSNMYGALGAIGTPVVRTDAAAIWATGEFWWQVPPTVQVVLEGKLSPGVTGKNVIITLCGLYNQEEVLNAAVEFSGPGVASLSMDARLSIANMTTEWGALVGWFPVDEVTIAYLENRDLELRRNGTTRIPRWKLTEWRNNPPRPDDDALYAGRIVLNLDEVTPHVSGPDTVQVMQSVAEIEKRNIKIQKAYLVSCVNSRLEDLAAAAEAIQGKKVARDVKFYLAPASRSVQEDAERQNIWQTLLEAGAQPLPPGCGPCIGLGTGLLEAGEVGISATNRNFKGRMGSRDAQCYLASPEVVAAALARFEQVRADCRSTLHDRLIAALEAGAASGGDRRCEPALAALSAFLEVAGPDDAPDAPSLRLVVTPPFEPAPGIPTLLRQLVRPERATEYENPVKKLRAMYDAWRGEHEPVGRCSDQDPQEGAP